MKPFSNVIAMLTLSTQASACAFDMPMPFEEVVENARHISVVQILSQELTERVEFRRPVIAGRLKVIEVLLGEPAFESVEFSNGPCGGVRLDVGHYYVVFTSQSGSTLRLVPADNAMIGLAGQYNPMHPKQNHQERFLRSVRDFIDGDIPADAVDPFPLIERNGTLRRINCEPCMLHCPTPGAGHESEHSPDAALRANQPQRRTQPASAPALATRKFSCP